MQSPVEEKSFTFPIVDKIRGMSYDAAMAKSRSSSTGSYIGSIYFAVPGGHG